MLNSQLEKRIVRLKERIKELEEEQVRLLLLLKRVLHQL
tara:strand:- start:833 stop:949 length:117 start_codon:yes stop_codon:yes gene_type:complete